MSDDKPYLFPAPAPVLRAGLNAIAESGREFTRDEATCDVMLDLDLVASGRLKKLHAYRYYARRWGWSKTLVAYAFVGRPDRKESPWIEERATSFRSFFGERLRTNGERLRTKTSPEEAENPDLRTSGGHLRTSGGQSRTDSQTTDTDNKASKEASARARPVELPDWIDPRVWSDWEQHRREIRKPLKPTTVTRQLKQLENWRSDGHDPNEIIIRSITNGWTGLFAPDAGASRVPANPPRAGATSQPPVSGSGADRHSAAGTEYRHRGDPGTPGTTGSERAGMRGPKYAIDLVNRALADLPPRADEAEPPGTD